MSTLRWHIERNDAILTLSRRIPVQFDLAVDTVLPAGKRLKLAQQVRQDMWRALQDLRGFSPAVRVEACGDGLKVTAGGQVDGVFPRAQSESRIAEVLECPKNRARWMRWAS